jgi:hypothetical protein
MTTQTFPYLRSFIRIFLNEKNRNNWIFERRTENSLAGMKAQPDDCGDNTGGGVGQVPVCLGLNCSRSALHVHIDTVDRMQNQLRLAQNGT